MVRSVCKPELTSLSVQHRAQHKLDISQVSQVNIHQDTQDNILQVTRQVSVETSVSKSAEQLVEASDLTSVEQWVEISLVAVGSISQAWAGESAMASTATAW